MPKCEKRVLGPVRFLIAVLTLWLLATPAAAQIGGSGSIQGVVSDPSGAVIPGATVVATNVGTAVKTTRQTTDAGYYVISPLPAGEYTVTVSATGFQTLVQEHVIVDALSQVGLNATLTVGATTQEVTVSAAPPALDTVDNNLSYTTRQVEYQALPLAMGILNSANNIARDPTNFVVYLPGVNTTNYTGQSAGSVLASPAHYEEVYVEGIPDTQPIDTGETRYVQEGMSIEAVDQYQMMTSGTPVMYAGQGAVNYVLKSGTNKFHFEVFEYFRNTDLDARGFFATAKPAEHRNEYGATAGGPIKKDKIFFFASFDGYKMRTITVPTLYSIPTAKERLGNFSELAQPIYDPLSTNCPTGGVCTRTVFAGNIITPQETLSPISQYLQSALPAPTYSGTSNNYLSYTPANFNVDQTTDRVDWNLSNSHRLYIMGSHGQKTQVTPCSLNRLPLPYGDCRLIYEIPTMYQIRETWVISPTLVNQLGFGFSRLWVPEKNVTISGDWMDKAGLTGLPEGGEAAEEMPPITFSGSNTPPGGWRNGGNSQAFNEAANSFAVIDNLQWTRGIHSVTFGYQMERNEENIRPQDYGNTATWTFSNNETAGFSSSGTLNTATGNAYASFLLGAVDSNTITDDYVDTAAARFRDYAWWAQDAIKIRPNFTLTLGVRYDLDEPWVEAFNHMSWLNPTMANPAINGFPGALQFAGYGPDSCQCRNDFATYYRAFAPRGGFAYTLNSKTVVRGGYMMTYSRDDAVGGYDVGANRGEGTGLLGYQAIPTFSSPNSGITPAYYWNNGVPAYQKAPFFSPSYGTGYYGTLTSGGTVYYSNPAHAGKMPRFQNWNFSVQHSFAPTLTLEVDYVGSNAHFLTGEPIGSSGPALGYWSDQIPPADLVLGNLLNATATAANIAAAQAIVPSVALPYTGFNGSIAQMLRAFPQYGSVVAMWQNVGDMHYNALEVIARKTLSRGLIVDFNYTWQKLQDNLYDQSGWISQPEQTGDPASVLNGIFVYALPFGAGHYVSGGGNRVARQIIGGWSLSGITTYRDGPGLGSFGASCNLPDAGSCWASYAPGFTGSARIGTRWGFGNLTGAASSTSTFLNLNAFVSPAAYTYGTTPRVLAYGLRGPGYFNQNMSLRREFKITEAVTLRFQMDAVNVFNNVMWSSPSTTITSSGFGKITGQSNQARVVQFNARVVF